MRGRTDSYRFFGLDNYRQTDRKRRAAAGLALDGYVATHHLTEAFADRESKPRAAVFARCRCIGLRELLEQPALLLRRHADAGIGNGERDPVALVFLPLPHIDGDAAALGKFVGVAQKVQ